MVSKNITLTLPDELIRQAKVLAAQRDTSVSALVGTLLGQALGDVADYDGLWSAEEAAMLAGPLHLGPRTWTRDDLHAR